MVHFCISIRKSYISHKPNGCFKFLQMKEVQKLKRLPVASPRKSSVTAKSKRVNARLSSDYEKMLRIYLVNKQQLELKKEAKYVNLSPVRKVDNAKVNSTGIWNNVVQLVRKSNQLISSLSRPVLALMGE
jgi:hypothetical protein